MARSYTARVVFGEHSVRVLERFLDGQPEEDDDLGDVNIAERAFDTQEEMLAYRWGVIDSCDGEYHIFDEDVPTDQADWIRFEKATGSN